MPAEIIEWRGHEYYARRGGAYKRMRNGGFKYVGYGNGDHARRNIARDKMIKAKVNKKKWKTGPQSYDKGRGGL